VTWADRILRFLSSASLVTFGVLVATKVDRFTFNQNFAANAHIVLPAVAIFILGASLAWIVMTVMRHKFRATIKNHMGPIYKQILDERDATIETQNKVIEDQYQDLEDVRGRLNRILAASKEPLELMQRRRSK